MCLRNERCADDQPSRRSNVSCISLVVVKKQTEDYKVEMKVTPGKARLHARIVSFRKTHVVA